MVRLKRNHLIDIIEPCIDISNIGLTVTLLQLDYAPVHLIFQVLKRPVGTYQISFDLDLKAPKKSKAGKSNGEVLTNSTHSKLQSYFFSIEFFEWNLKRFFNGRKIRA